MILPIKVHPSHALKKAAELTKPDVDGTFRSHNQLILDMLDTMREHKALGLAANQVGSPVNLFVMEAHPRPLAAFNPVLLKAHGEVAIGPEGCLSFPGMPNAPVFRHTSINLEYQNVLGTRCNWLSSSPLEARAIQHELDHLAGILFVARMKPEVRTRFLETYARRKVNQR